MAFTAATALTEVRAILNEATAYFWSDTEINNWIKQGCLDWCEKSLLLIKDDTITLVTDQVDYTTSGSSYIDDAMFAEHVEFDDKAMQRLTYEQIRGHNQLNFASDSPPKYYFDEYDGLVYTFQIYPAPSATYNTQTVSVGFCVRTDDITEIPYQHQQTIFLYAAAKAHHKDRQFQDSALAYQQYTNNIIFARRDKMEKQEMTLDKFRVK